MEPSTWYSSRDTHPSINPAHWRLTSQPCLCPYHHSTWAHLGLLDQFSFILSRPSTCMCLYVYICRECDRVVVGCYPPTHVVSKHQRTKRTRHQPTRSCWFLERKSTKTSAAVETALSTAKLISGHLGTTEVVTIYAVTEIQDGVRPRQLVTPMFC